jgi:hypothetical protein
LLQDEEHNHSLPIKTISKFPRILIPFERKMRNQCEKLISPRIGNYDHPILAHAPIMCNFGNK